MFSLPIAFVSINQITYSPFLLETQFCWEARLNRPESRTPELQMASLAPVVFLCTQYSGK